MLEQILKDNKQTLNKLWKRIREYNYISEEKAETNIMCHSFFRTNQFKSIGVLSFSLIQELRKKAPKFMSIERILQAYPLNTKEGKTLLCLAQELLKPTSIIEKRVFLQYELQKIEWTKPNQSDLFSSLIYISVKLTTRILNYKNTIFLNLIKKVIVHLYLIIIKNISKNYIAGKDIQGTIKYFENLKKQGATLTYDILGESVCNEKEADINFQSYYNTLTQIKKLLSINSINSKFSIPTLSIKLSALSSIYETNSEVRIINNLTPKLVDLCLAAKKYGIGITIDAEKSAQTLLNLKILKNVFTHPSLKNWNGMGIAVQAYQKRSPLIISWLALLAKKYNKILNIRLVKGAYWDYEINHTTVHKKANCSVYTKKYLTDANYLLCANLMLQSKNWIYSQFATHNAHTLLTVHHLIKRHNVRRYEFQRLQGMAEVLYESIRKYTKHHIPCRIYAPIENSTNSAEYLIRRFIESGAVNSFISQVYDKKVSLDKLITNPLLDNLIKSNA